MARMEPGPSVNAEDISSGIFVDLKVTQPSFFWRGYHPSLKLSGIPTFTFIVSLTQRMDNI